MRRLCKEGLVYESIDKRYINYKLFDKFDTSERFYTIPTSIDINSPERIKIHIAEGPFDILSVYRNLRNMEPGIYTSIAGSNYKGIAMYFLEVYKLPYVELHFYPDNDQSNEVIEKIAKYVEPMLIPVYIDRNIKEGEKVIIGVGFPFNRKGIKDFFEIARKRPDVKFIWFGHLGHMLTQLKVLRAIKKRTSNVLMPGYVDIKVLRGAFYRANTFLFMSKEENEGIAVLEAMASHLPVIVRDIPVFNDWLTDKVNCLKGNTIDDFINSLNYVFNNDTKELTDNAYKVVEERTLDHVGDQIKEIYDMVYKMDNNK
jgi:glycosyltransferase involved in cell wall biosynthesis